MLYFTEVRIKKVRYIKRREYFNISVRKDDVVIVVADIVNQVCFDQSKNSIFVLWRN